MGQKGYFCEKKDCGFKLWKESKFWTSKKKLLTPAIVAALLKDERVGLKGLYSEKIGKEYIATVILDNTGEGFVGFKMKLGK
jgi:DNA topoisomerase-3